MTVGRGPSALLDVVRATPMASSRNVSWSIRWSQAAL